MREFVRMGWALVLALSPPAIAAEAKVADVRSAVEQWVQAQQVISKTKADWQAEKELLLQTKALFERELKAIEEQSARTTSTNSVAEAERAEADAELARLNQGLTKATALVAELETEAR